MTTPDFKAMIEIKLLLGSNTAEILAFLYLELSRLNSHVLIEPVVDLAIERLADKDTMILGRDFIYEFLWSAVHGGRPWGTESQLQDLVNARLIFGDVKW